MPSGDRSELPVAAPASPAASAPDSAAAPAAALESPAPTLSPPVATPEEGASPGADTTGPAAAEPAAGEQPQAEEAAPTETPPAEPEKPKLHTDTPTLMELAGKEQPKPPEGDQPQSEAQEPRSYEPFTLPEGLSHNQDRMTEAATTLFAADNLSQERAQAYVDYHIAEMQRFAQSERQAQHDNFASMRADWVKQVMADPEMGGNRFQTAMTSIAIARDLFVSNAEPTSERYAAEMKEFNDMLRITGAGDHPAFNRLLLNVARKWQEPAAPTISFTPPADIGRRPNGAGTNRRQAMYGTVDPTPRG